ANRLIVRLFWLDREPLRTGDRLKLKLGTAERDVEVETVTEALDVESLSASGATQIERNGVARVILKSRRPLAVDLYDVLARTGRGVLIRGPQIAGGFIVEDAQQVANDIVLVDSTVTPADRARVNGHRGGVLWLTGLSGAGKSSLAMPAQADLFARGRQVAVLDGDNLRHGLNRDLGFSDEDRLENIRRLAEVASLMARNGMIVIVSAISPLQQHRDLARTILGADFHEIYIRADLAVCEARDPKGLYKRARAGEIAHFTGISAPYEAPSNPALIVDTGTSPL